jgi:tetratricopeptide (TPR) repeat protein
VSQRLAVAEQYQWQTYAHVRAEENAAALDAVRRSIRYYSLIPASAGRTEFAENYASTLKLAADVTMRAGQHEEALRHIQHATVLYRDLNDDGAIQQILRFQAGLLQEMGRHQEATEILAESKKHGLAYKNQVDKWYREEVLLLTENKESRPYERPRPVPLDPTLKLVVPIGHFAGPMYTSVDAEIPESFEVRFRDGVYSLSPEEYAVWAVSHGDPSLVTDQAPTTREVAEWSARAAGVPEPGPILDSLIEDGLLVETCTLGDQAQEFARHHRVIPLALGLGNSPQNPAEFHIGLPNAARVSVGYDVYHTWLFSHRAPNLWDALLTIAEEARESNKEVPGGDLLVDDPDVLLSALLQALQVLISTSCVFIDRCD